MCFLQIIRIFDLLIVPVCILIVSKSLQFFSTLLWQTIIAPMSKLILRNNLCLLLRFWYIRTVRSNVEYTFNYDCNFVQF